MRSTIDIDKRLLGEVKKLTGLKTKKAVVNFSLKELIRRKKEKTWLICSEALQWISP